MVPGEVNLEMREVKGSTQLIYVKKKCYFGGVGTVQDRRTQSGDWINEDSA